MTTTIMTTTTTTKSGGDDNEPPPYLETLGDPLDKDGYVHLSSEPGMGYRIDWDYIEANKA